MNALEEYLYNYFQIPPKEVAKVASLFHEESLEKESYFSKKGSFCRRLSFIQTGFLRV